MTENCKTQASAVTVIGSANIDITCFSNEKIIKEDSNPAKMKICPGGVGRNIAANLALLNIKPKLIAALGDDGFSEIIKKDCAKTGIDIEDSLICPGEISPAYVAFLENSGEMNAAMNCMDILNNLCEKYIESKKDIISQSKIIVLDTNIPVSTIGYVCRNFKNSHIYIDAVSYVKAAKIKEHIGFFHTIKMNKTECMQISEISIDSEKDLKNCAEFFLKKGVKRIFVTLGAEGSFYADEFMQKKFSAEEIKPVNVTGAGDAYMAGIVYSSLKGFDADKTVAVCAKMAKEALLSEETVSPEINEEKILNIE